MLKTYLSAATLMMLLVGGCASPQEQPQAPAMPAARVSSTTQPAADQAVVANVGPAKVTMGQLHKALVEAYGLNILLNLVQLEIARQNVVAKNLTVTPDDIRREREQTVEKMFEKSNEKINEQINDAINKNDTETAERLKAEMKRDNERGLEQFLAQQQISRAEFDIVTETNAYLHKIAEPMIAGKITDDQLREAFGALYGETVKCRHIQLANLQEVAEAKQRLAAGQPFAKVAQDMSRHHQTGQLGGELPAFSMQMQGFPQAFRDAAFALKEGEVSDPVQAEGAYHLILLEKRIPPKVVKFEDVKDSLRTRLEATAMDSALKELRGQLADQAVAGLKINDPSLKQQWEKKLEKSKADVKERDQIRKNLERQRPSTTPTTPASQPAASDLSPAR